MTDRRQGRRAPQMYAAIAAVGALLSVLALIGGPAYAVAPTISSFSPTSGVLATKVTITGTGFTSPATVQFNGGTGTSTVVSSSTQITTKVPTTAGSGPISVTTAGGTATSASSFTVLPGLAVSGTAGGHTGAAVSLTFSGFSPYEAVDIYFDSTDLVLASASGTGAGTGALNVPATASAGQHWFTAIGRHSGSAAQVAYAVRTDWPTTGFGPSRPSYNKYEHTLNVDNIDDLDLGWRTPAMAASAATPVIARGLVFVGAGDSSVRAFDVNTGVQKWTRATSAPAESGATVAGGVVYIGTDAGQLLALDAATGAVKWTYSVPGGGVIESAPVVVSGIVYFGAQDGKVHALTASTGAQIWAYSVGSAVDYTPAVLGGTLFVTTHEPSVLALNAATGVMKWDRVDTSTGAGYAASPIILGGLLYIGSINGTFTALHTSDGSLAWTYATTGAIRTTAAAGKQTVYVGDDSGTVYAIRSTSSQLTGVLQWSQAVDSGPLRQALAVANGVVYAGGNLTRTWALDASSGELAGIVPANDVGGGPAIVDGTITIVDANFGVVSHYVLPEGAAAAVKRPSPPTLRPNWNLKPVATTKEGGR